MPEISIMLKPVSGACNQHCTYCFYMDEMSHRAQSSFGTMSPDTLRSVIAKALSSAERQCTIAFQGGEPTLAGLDFYRQVVALELELNHRGIAIQNCLQTNGLLIDDAWAAFLAEHRFLTGISIDGPRKLHDANRHMPGGAGTFQRVMVAVEAMRRAGAEFNVLTVVTERTAKNAAYVYRFLKKNRFDYLQFIPCLEPLDGPDASRDDRLTAKAYGAFLCTVFDLWYADLKQGCAPYILLFENYIRILMGLEPEACDQRGTCSKQYVVEADGGIYPCDFFVLDSYRLGNLNTDTLAEVDAAREQKGFAAPSLRLDGQCRACPYLALCRCGCRRMRRFNEAGEGRHILCEGYQAFFSHCAERMAEIARTLKDSPAR